MPLDAICLSAVVRETAAQVENTRIEKIQQPARDQVILLPGHISGMGGEGARAEIVEVMAGVAYMVDFTPTDGSEPIFNHQWVSEEELLPYELPANNG